MKISLLDVPKKKRVRKRRAPMVTFSDDEFVIHTDDNITQNSIVMYLNRNTWSNLMESINYKGQLLHCFPCISLEMQAWLRNSSNGSKCSIFHRKKDSEHAWVRLSAKTKVK